MYKIISVVHFSIMSMLVSLIIIAPFSVGATESSEKNTRTYESIMKVMSQTTTSVYKIYSKYLKQNPKLEGKVVYEITVSPTGLVKTVDVFSDNLNNAQLVGEIQDLFTQLEFGEKNVDEIKFQFPIDFIHP